MHTEEINKLKETVKKLQEELSKKKVDEKHFTKNMTNAFTESVGDVEEVKFKEWGFDRVEKEDIDL